MALEAVAAAYRGEWPQLLRFLKSQPGQINAVSSKGYTPLHQAAWHGASREVIGALLAHGADVSARTLNRDQTAADIASEKHSDREDLRFLLRPKGRSPA